MVCDYASFVIVGLIKWIETFRSPAIFINQQLICTWKTDLFDCINQFYKNSKRSEITYPILLELRLIEICFTLKNPKVSIDPSFSYSTDVAANNGGFTRTCCREQNAPASINQIFIKSDPRGLATDLMCRPLSWCLKVCVLVPEWRHPCRFYTIPSAPSHLILMLIWDFQLCSRTSFQHNSQVSTKQSG